MVRSPRPAMGGTSAFDETFDLSPALWDALDDICRREDVRLPDLLAGIRRSFEGQPLAAAAERFVAVYFRRVVQAQEINRAARN